MKVQKKKEWFNMKSYIAEYEQKLIKEIENGKFFSLKTLRKVIELDSLIKTYK